MLQLPKILSKTIKAPEPCRRAIACESLNNKLCGFADIESDALQTMFRNLPAPLSCGQTSYSTTAWVLPAQTSLRILRSCGSDAATSQLRQIDCDRTTVSSVPAAAYGKKGQSWRPQGPRPQTERVGCASTKKPRRTLAFTKATVMLAI